MQPVAFLCPECSTPLRLKDRSQIGREIDCPDCGQSLKILAEAGEVRAVRAPSPSAATPPTGPRTALRLIWLATAFLGVVIVWLANRTGNPPAEGEHTTVAEPAPAVEEPMAEVVETVQASPPAEPIAPVVREPPPTPMLPTVEIPAEVAMAAEDRPLLPDLAPDSPPVDVAAQLALPITEYSQTSPVPARLLLRQMAELSAVPVDLSQVETENWKARLDQAVTVELRQTTVGNVLEEILRQAGLSYFHRDGVIFVAPSEMSGHND